jgi:hypothetical protein
VAALLKCRSGRSETPASPDTYRPGVDANAAVAVNKAVTPVASKSLVFMVILLGFTLEAAVAAFLQTMRPLSQDFVPGVARP